VKMEQSQSESNPESNPMVSYEKTAKIKKWLFGIVGVAVLGIAASLWLPNDDKEAKQAPKVKKIRTERNGVLKDTINGHEWVDLGLPSGTRWATYNVGAGSPEEFGDFYSWGETEPKSEYVDINSLTHRKDFKWLVKNGIINEDGELTNEHDAATTVWGEPWRMPTEEEFGELIDLCEWQFTSYYGVNGYLVTGPNEQTLFIVAAGFQQGEEPEYVGEYGDYWTSTVVPELIGASCSLGYSPKSYGRRRYARFVGRSIRPVLD
ncbi:MAG: hypothetical protein K2N48_14730, partial [Muribaculaceae bacterium]|nr:hypothetical protein [Muribaculaceae bacterium]